MNRLFISSAIMGIALGILLSNFDRELYKHNLENNNDNIVAVDSINSTTQNPILDKIFL